MIRQNRKLKLETCGDHLSGPWINFKFSRSITQLVALLSYSPIKLLKSTNTFPQGIRPGLIQSSTQRICRMEKSRDMLEFDISELSMWF